MTRIDFIQELHASTKRDYVGRVTEFDKAECAETAKRFDRDYWDGPRQFGYGGYRYDGRWRAVAEKMVAHYGIRADHHILDIGAGKGYLLYEFTQVVPGVTVTGLDISEYAVANAKEEIAADLDVGNARALPYRDNSFDFVVSLGTLHNLRIDGLFDAVGEIERVRRGPSYVMVESYRNEREKANLLYWQLTCESFYSPEEWEWVLERNGYCGDWGFIFFT